jgi:hypothetical protein
MIAIRHSRARLAAIEQLQPPPPPTVDLAGVMIDERGIRFAPRAIEHGLRVWLLDPKSGRRVSAQPVSHAGVHLPLDGFRPRGEYTVYVAGLSGWAEVVLGPKERLVRPARPQVDGSGIGFSESAFYCREPSVIGYDRVILTLRHPVGGAERRHVLRVDMLSGTFDTHAYLGLGEGDHIRFEAKGRDGGFVRELVFPKAPDRWRTYSLDELTRS